MGFGTREIPAAISYFEQTPEAITDNILVKRPGYMHANQLGLLEIDPRDFEPTQAVVLAAAQDVERDRGKRGFSPNTIKAVWIADDLLSLAALAGVARSYNAWEYANYDFTLVRES